MNRSNQSPSQAQKTAATILTFPLPPADLTGATCIATDDDPIGESVFGASIERLWRTVDGKFVLEQEDMLLNGKPVTSNNVDEYEDELSRQTHAAMLGKERRKQVSSVKTHKPLTMRQAMKWCVQANQIPNELQEAFASHLPTETETPVCSLDDDAEFKAVASAKGWHEIISGPMWKSGSYWRAIVMDKTGHLFDVTKDKAPRRLSTREAVQAYREIWMDYHEQNFGYLEHMERFLKLVEQAIPEAK